MAIVIPIVLLVCAAGCAAVAYKLAESRGRNPIGWAIFTVAVGATIYVVERFVWTRPDGDSVSAGSFDMQTLLPVFAMLGAAFIMTQLPNLTDDD